MELVPVGTSFLAYFSISQTMLKMSIGPHSGAKIINSNIFILLSFKPISAQA